LDDGAHSPDSIAVYDPRDRLLLVGDLTYEYNPLWPSGTYRHVIENLRTYRDLTGADEVPMLGDGPNHRLFRGADEILPLLNGLVATHEWRRANIVRTAGERGLRPVESVRRALVAGDAEFAWLARER
jgi:glyoxylase-like metal-dependent hydrolase (beta-lactamase superfamily II)